VQIALLTLLKFVLLALLYLFLARAVKAILTDLYGPRKKSAPPRPAVASTPPPGTRKSRKVPREIVVHPPSGRPQVHQLGGHGAIIGRSSQAAVVIEDVYASDEHAEILPDDGGWSVRDLGSTNGTYLNGAKVTRPTPLAAGDQLRLGKTNVEVRR
jgi:hypothetical protein